ncbi:hypothetical protein B0I37DRAFT_436915 [Chaetomium sp. MPI-CAGE-AT-0009]|nr:hypothetical protein B0I37DRAFT_436915 [Chaetomium sp. MPI-CAGE-AT-0009]
MGESQFQQEPVAIIGFACRLPGGNHTPQKLWDFLQDGGVAPNTVPKSRFNIHGHYDGSRKPGTMRPKGGMFLSEDIDLASFDAGFFEFSGADAVATDPNQRQMLEIVYEGLENAGITLQDVDNAPVACYAASYATDYLDMQNRDAEDRPANTLVGTARAVLANRISYFLNIKGPSVTLDTACSGSIVGLDLACKSLQAGEVSMAIVAASNLYLNPDHVMDIGSVGGAHSPTALCHTFDADADGYVKAEAVSCIVVKKLADAIRDGDPVRAVVRGTSSNSNGRTVGVGGIVAPNAEAQAAAIRMAYARAGITDLNETSYLECHGTGTPAGDPTEVHGAGSVFAPTRDADRPLIIGSVVFSSRLAGPSPAAIASFSHFPSIKSNVGHSEPAAGISGLIKIVLSLERGIIPGNPTFVKPNPKIDFIGNKVKASRVAIPWPTEGYAMRRASINSFGYGGSNAHAVIDQPSLEARSRYLASFRGDGLGLGHGEDDLEGGEEDQAAPRRLYTLVLSANDASTLKANISALCSHLSHPSVSAPLTDLAYTLSERRSRLWHHAYATTDTTDGLDESDFVISKRTTRDAPQIAYVFTGQGAQWPQMGKDLLALFPQQTLPVLQELDQVLQAQPDPPQWSLVAELTQPRSAEHLRQPEFSQPLVTALQLCLLAVMDAWGVKASAVVGHSSGEIAAAYAAGLLDRAGAIKAAFYRGRAAMNCRAEGRVRDDVGMLAVGLGADATMPFLENHAAGKGRSGPPAWIACYNSPKSVTVSGDRISLDALAAEIKGAGHFARLLQVDLAYHSPLMGAIGDEYERLLDTDQSFQPLKPPSAAAAELVSGQVPPRPRMFSSVSAAENDSPADARYWKRNMVSPVRFAEALAELIAAEKPTVLMELGPSGALAGPATQVLQSSRAAEDIAYMPALARGSGASKALMDLAGRLLLAGAPVDMAVVNAYDRARARTIIDLPNYQWNHTGRYWHENAASAGWRSKRFITHDLLGSKIPGTSWEAPTWRKKLRLADVPWLRDHRMGPDVLIPGTAFASMALEAMFQKHCATRPDEAAGISSPNELAYRFRNIKFDRAVVVEEAKPTNILLTLASVPGSPGWHEFRVRTTTPTHDVVYEHCSGLVRVLPAALGDDYALHGEQLAPLRHPQSPAPWYKLQTSIGTHFGPAFQKIKQWESVSGQHHCRAILSLEPPPARWNPQTYYPIHPAVLDACLQTSTPAILAGERSTLRDVMILARVDEMVINAVPRQLADGLSVAEAVWTGRGRKDKSQSWATNVDIHDPDTGGLFLRVRGLEHIRLDVEEKPDTHVFQAVQWKPDISLVTQEHLMYDMVPGRSSFSYSPDLSEAAQQSRLDALLNLVAHKMPRLTVLEIDLDGQDRAAPLWPQPADSASRAARAACTRFVFSSTNAQTLAAVEMAHAAGPHREFYLLAPHQPSLGLPDAATTDQDGYDLVIIQSSTKTALVDAVLAKAKRLVRPRGFTLLILSDHGSSHVEVGSSDEEDNAAVDAPFGRLSPGESSSGADSVTSSSPVLVTKPSTSGDTTPTSMESATNHHHRRLDHDTTASPGDVGEHSAPQILMVPIASASASGRSKARRAYLYHGWNAPTPATDSPQALRRELVVVRFAETAPTLGPAMRNTLAASGWSISVVSAHELSHSGQGTTSRLVSAADVVLVLDNLVKPVLVTISVKQWEALKTLLAGGLRRPVLWVTKGAQTERVTDPGNALVQGLFRVVRREEPGARLTTLDVQSAASPATHWAIDQVLRRIVADLDLLDKHAGPGAVVAEAEYAERDGVLLVPRLVPDTQLCDFKTAELGAGHELVVRGLHANPAQVRLQADKIGTLQSLKWCEITAGEIPVEPGKDVATTMGIVPENEHTIGCECAGSVTRIGAGVTGFKAGDRVVAQTNGTYVNRLQCVADRVHRIPDSLSYDEAATIPLVYLTAIYALFHLGNLREGQIVLIHSAAGGVGIAAIQLAQYKKADIFVTVGTQDKRKFLTEAFGIPSNRIFSSRNAQFAEEIRRETHGRGVDVILNSLVGELLDESWRLTADGGVMVEIGKRDIVDRNTLAMEPFDRNCSFRAVDLSYVREISDQLIGRLLGEVFDLVEAGHIGPIRPITRYGFDDVISALSEIRRGQHRGKIVISSGDKELEDVQVPTRPAIRKLELKPDVAYLVVGGLKGLCGSLAVHMARHGARHIVAMSRSGIDDPASAKVVENCRSYGCRVTDAKGDVGDRAFVRRVFRTVGHIAGVIQGAMILRDKPYELMTVEEYHTAIHAKVAGTWNLHVAAQEAKPLDFFTMLSSISGVVGNKGQANYAAGNAFLDAFAHFRRQQGLRANTVDLGLIQDVGYVAAAGGAALEARFDRREWTPIDEGMLRRILGYSLMQQDDPPRVPLSPASAAQIVTGIAYPLAADVSDFAGDARFGYLFGGRSSSSAHGDAAGGAASGGAESDQGIRAFQMMHAAGADGAALAKAAVGLLQKQIAQLLRLDGDRDLEPGKPLMAYGLDSLSAVELRGWVRQKLGAELSTLDITNASSLVGLCEKLVSKLPPKMEDAAK